MIKKNFFIIVDVSGSMNEMGKIHIQSNLCLYITQLRNIEKKKYEDLNFHFYQWAQNISKFIIQNNEDIPTLNAKGFSNLNALSDFLFQHLKNTEDVKILVMSDGNFSCTDIVNFKNQLSIFHNIIIRTIAIGADADLLKLKEISTNNTIYLSEDISSAIDNTIFGSNEPLTAPTSIAQILQTLPSKTEELEEDWDA